MDFLGNTVCRLPSEPSMFLKLAKGMPNEVERWEQVELPGEVFGWIEVGRRKLSGKQPYGRPTFYNY